MTPHRGLLKIVVCAAGPAADVAYLVTLAHNDGWDVEIVATPPALDFIDTDALEELTGHQVRSQYRQPGEPHSREPAALVVAPATFNTINKLAAGISDTYALGVLAEGIGKAIPTVVLPFVNTALAARHPFQHSVANLRSEGVTVVLGPDLFEPHEPGTGDDRSFPWQLALDALGR